MSKTIDIKQIYIFYILYFLILPLGFLIRVFYSRTISVEDFGIIYSLIGFFGFISFFTNLGLVSSLSYFIPKFLAKKQFKNIKNIFYYTFFIQLLLLSLTSLFIYFFSGYIANNYFHNLSIKPLLEFFLLYFVFSNLLTSILAVFVSFRKNILYQSIKFLELFSVLSFSIIFFILFDTNLIRYYLYSWIIGYFLSFSIFLYLLYKKFPFFRKKPTWDKTLFVKFKNYSLYLFSSTLGTLILNQTDIMLIIYFLGFSQVAFYSTAFLLVQTVVGIFGSVLVIILPILIDTYEKKKITVLNNIINTFYSIIIFFILPALLVFSLFPEQLLSLLFGEEYVGASGVLRIFSLFLIFNIVSQYNLVFLNSFGMAKRIMIIIWPVAIMNLVLDIFFIQKMGIIGVAIITTTGWIIITILTLKILIKECNLSLDVFKIFKILLCGIIFIGIVLLFKKIIYIYNYYITSLTILFLGFISYILIGYFMKIFKINDLYIFFPEGKLKDGIRRTHNKYFPNFK